MADEHAVHPAKQGSGRAGGHQAGRTGQAESAGARERAEALSYEQARDQLANVVRRLEAGGLTLEDSLQLWERGERLAMICTEWLEGARARLATAMAGDRETAAGGGPPVGRAAAGNGGTAADAAGAAGPGDGEEESAPF